MAKETEQTQHKTIENLADVLSIIPEESIVSRTLLATPSLRLILFGFAPGQELTEHKTPLAATIHVLEGEGVVTLGEERQTVQPGTLIYMAPNLPHSVLAETPLKFLLTMAKENGR